MVFGNYCVSVPKEIAIKINNKNLKRVESYKYLGITIDYNGKWD